MNGNKISEKDLKALLILGCVLSFCVAYFIGYSIIYKSTIPINDENEQLQTRKAQLEAMELNRERMQAETKEYQEKYDEVVKEFPSKVTIQGIIMDMVNLEKETGTTKITSLNAVMNTLFYPEATVQAPVGDPDDDVTTPYSGTSETGDGETPAEGEEQDNGTVTVYKSTATLSVEQLPYSGLKKICEIARKHNTRMTIDSCNVQFGTNGGLLEGAIDISFYSLDGSKTGYKEPEVKGIDLGLSNIFGTFERKN